MALSTAQILDGARFPHKNKIYGFTSFKCTFKIYI